MAAMEAELKARLREIDKRENELRRESLQTSTRLQREDYERQKIINKLKELEIEKLNDKYKDELEQKAKLELKVKQLKESLDKGTSVMKRYAIITRAAEEERDAMKIEMRKLETMNQEFAGRIMAVEEERLHPVPVMEQRPSRNQARLGLPEVTAEMVEQQIM